MQQQPEAARGTTPPPKSATPQTQPRGTTPPPKFATPQSQPRGTTPPPKAAGAQSHAASSSTQQNTDSKTSVKQDLLTTPRGSTPPPAPRGSTPPAPQGSTPPAPRDGAGTSLGKGTTQPSERGDDRKHTVSPLLGQGKTKERDDKVYTEVSSAKQVRKSRCFSAPLS